MTQLKGEVSLQEITNRHNYDCIVKYYSNLKYFRMISERSCDTEDWSNDAENST